MISRYMIYYLFLVMETVFIRSNKNKIIIRTIGFNYLTLVFNNLKDK